MMLGERLGAPHLLCIEIAVWVAGKWQELLLWSATQLGQTAHIGIIHMIALVLGLIYRNKVFDTTLYISCTSM